MSLGYHTQRTLSEYTRARREHQATVRRCALWVCCVLFAAVVLYVGR